MYQWLMGFWWGEGIGWWIDGRGLRGSAYVGLRGEDVTRGAYVGVWHAHGDGGRLHFIRRPEWQIVRRTDGREC